MNHVDFSTRQDIHTHSIDFWLDRTLGSIGDIGTLSKTRDEWKDQNSDQIITTFQVVISSQSQR